MPGPGPARGLRWQVGRIWHKFDLFAAFNIADGTVISSLHRRHRAAEFKKFLARIDKNVPAGLDVHLVCDSLARHKTPAIQQ